MVPSSPFSASASGFELERLLGGAEAGGGRPGSGREADLGVVGAERCGCRGARTARLGADAGPGEGNLLDAARGDGSEVLLSVAVGGRPDSVLAREDGQD